MDATSEMFESINSMSQEFTQDQRWSRRPVRARRWTQWALVALVTCTLSATGCAHPALKMNGMDQAGLGLPAPIQPVLPSSRSLAEETEQRKPAWLEDNQEAEPNAIAAQESTPVSSDGPANSASSVTMTNNVMTNNVMTNNVMANNTMASKGITPGQTGTGSDDSGEGLRPVQESGPIFRGQDPGSTSGTPFVPGDPGFAQDGNAVPQTGFFPQAGTLNGPGIQQQNQQIGGYGEPTLLIGPNAPAGILQGYPQNFADIDVFVQEAQSGRIMIGGAFNSDNGLTGNIVIDEKNFDITRWPRSFRDITNGTAWRGGGQSFRMELVPGNEVQRYLVSFSEPYLLNSLVSLSASGYYYTRNYFDWDEQRLGGRVSLGYRLNHDLSVSVGTRLENIQLTDPRVNTSPQLNNDLGASDLYAFFVSLTHDTRDNPFLATQGAYLQLKYQQAFGDFDFPRGDIDYRRYFRLYERPDGSGRHTLRLGTRLGFTGGQTPVYENYFAGGFSTMRGFDFRGASPIEGGVRVGGEFQWLNTVEYMFPITADDMIKGVAFVDFGTVEQDIEVNADNFRIAPGFGVRVHMPAAGMGGAPLAFDFAFPVAEAAGDDKQVFTFYIGLSR